jgi:hypothetical protein
VPEGGLVRLERDKRFSGTFSKYKIRVDGRKVGAITNGDVVEIRMNPGNHVLRLQHHGGGSPAVPFSLQEGETIHFSCRWALTDSMVGLAFHFQSLFKPDSWIVLESGVMARSDITSRSMAVEVGSSLIAILFFGDLLFEFLTHHSWILAAFSAAFLALGSTGLVAAVFRQTRHTQTVHRLDLRSTEGGREPNSAA